MKNLVLQTGLKMPVIGLGTWQADDPVQLEAAMDAAFECGYRHFDTAFLYANEKVVGQVVKKWIDSGVVKRKDLFITTKLPFAGVHPDRVEMFLNKSLENLGLNYVDLYLIHFPVCIKYVENNSFPVDDNGEIQTEPTDHVAVWKKMEEQVISGKTKTIGLSNFTIEQITRILRYATIKPANLQVETHLYYQNNDLLDFCKERGISVVAYSPLGCPGLNKMNEKYGFPLTDLPDIMANPTVVSTAKKHSKTPAQIMLRFLIQRGLAAIPKSTTPDRIKENISIFDFELDETDMSDLRKLDQGDAGKLLIVDRMKGLDKHPEFPYKKQIVN